MKQRGVFCNMKKIRTKNVEEYIIDSLFALMKNKRYENISITEIVKKAGASRVSFYRNFNSKEDIVAKWIDKVTDEFLNRSNISFKNNTNKEYFMKLFTHLNEHKERGLLICKAGLDYLLKNKFDEVFINNYLNESNAYKVYYVSGGIYNIYYYWLSNGCKETPDELSNKLVNLLLN